MPADPSSPAGPEHPRAPWARAALVLALVAVCALVVAFAGPFFVFGEFAVIIVIAIAPVLALGPGAIAAAGLVVAILQRRRRGAILAIIADAVVIVVVIAAAGLAAYLVHGSAAPQTATVGEPRAFPGDVDGLPAFEGEGVAELVDAGAWALEGNTDHADEIAVGAVLEGIDDELVYYDVWVDVDVYDASGELAATERGIVSLTPGQRSVAVATFREREIPDDAAETVIAIAGYHARADARTAVAADVGTYTIADVTTATADDVTRVTGTLTSTAPAIADIDAALVIRNGDGQMIAVRPDTVRDVPAQASIDYAEEIPGILPRGATVEVFAGHSAYSPVE
ncbi:hypothetical protein [Microbacterium karelineae]|uniref:hypothetical protein n=1 Tax=Microbacterium karelineae TaxID=2654283 RepID=UPI0012EAA91F|nr:hypothetical protein [Microbacterium karelineae]